MGQNIQIGVDANVGGAEAAVNKLDRATEGAAESIRDVAKEAAGAERALENMAKAVERVKRAKEALKRETGVDVSDEDASTFLNNFDRQKAGRSANARRLRQFEDFDGWYTGHRMAYGKENAAAQHRRSVFASGMQGTQYSRNYGAPPPPTSPNGGGGDEGGGFGDGSYGRRAGSMAMGVLKGGLALAGLNSIMGLVGEGVSKATEEAISNSDLKSSLGALSVDFKDLRGNVRSAGEGLGVAYVEGQRLARQFATEAGGRAGADGNAGGVRSGIGLSRAYGLDPTSGVGFFGSMRRLGVAGDDQANRRLALMIGDVIEKSGQSAKADEVLQAISGFSEQAARMTLSTPNTGAFSSYLTSLMATGRPGLDPAGAASILNTADGAVRRGGAFGEASLNFSLAALLRSSPGMDPITAQGLMEGGLFGTTRNTFGSGSALGEWYGGKNVKTPGLDDKTNFEKMIPMLRQQYGADSPFYLEALKNHFGLSSLSQAAEVDKMADNPANLRQSQELLGRSGVDLSRVTVSGMQTISRIANSRTGAEVGAAYDGVMARGDLNEQERRKLVDAMGEAAKSGNVESLKEALVAVVGTKEQEQSEGQKTRESMAGIERATTSVGSMLLTPLNMLKDGVMAIAKFIVPGFASGIETAKENARIAAGYQDGANPNRPGVKTEPFVSGFNDFHKLNPNAGQRENFNANFNGAQRLVREAFAASKDGNVDLDKIAPRPDHDLLTREPTQTYTTSGRAVPVDPNENRLKYNNMLAQRQVAEQTLSQLQRRQSAGTGDVSARQALEGLPGGAVTSRQGGRHQLSDEAKAYLAETDRMLGLPAGTSERQIWQESRFNPNARSGKDARGLAQVLPRTARNISRKVGRNLDPYNPQDALLLHREVMRENMGRFGNSTDALRAYNGGWNPRNWNNPETRDYIDKIVGGGAVPDVATGGAGGVGGTQSVGVQFAPATVTLQDAAGRPRGQVTLNPFVSGTPAGS